MSQPSSTNYPQIYCLIGSCSIAQQGSLFVNVFIDNNLPMCKCTSLAILLYCYINTIATLFKYTVHPFVQNSLQGGFSRGAHLFPFRTQKLSPLAPMVLRKRESRSPPVFLNASIIYLIEAFFYVLNLKYPIIRPLLLEINEIMIRMLVCYL